MTTMCQAIFHILGTQVKKCIICSIYTPAVLIQLIMLIFFFIAGFNILTHHKLYLFLKCHYFFTGMKFLWKVGFYAGNK